MATKLIARMVGIADSLVLGDNPRLRRRLRTVGVVAAVYFLSILAQWHAVRSGLAQAHEAAWLSGFIVAGVAGFYAVIRAGLTLRVADPALALPQMVFAVLAIALAYHFNPLVRGALPMLAGLVVLFGAFSLAPRQARRLGWFAVAVFAVTMGWGAWSRPDVFVPLIELHHFVFVATVLVTMSWLTGLLGQVRASWKKQNSDLKEALQRLADGQQAMENAKNAAEQANLAKSRFLANTSHEIRTPMNGVLGMNELLLASDLTPEQRRWAQTMHASGRHLMAVIDDILDFSRIESDRLALEAVDFDLKAVVQDVVSMLGHAAHAKGLALSSRYTPDDAVPALRGDPFRLRQVLANLVGNAIKFTDAGAVTIGVSVGDRMAEGVALMISVEDTGIGIEPQAQQQIFEDFSQADGSTTRKYGGSGLGLAICRRLLQLMGGNISVRSEPGKGSTFLVRLHLPVAESPVMAPLRDQPVTLAPTDTAPAAPEIGKAARQLRGTVLLVEDNPVNQAVGKAMLKQLGLRCEVAGDGAQALARLGEAQFDVVLMDCQMPVMDGFEATTRIRRLPEARGATPIVALTANAMAGDEQRCLDAGMDAFLAKPFTMTGLHALLSRWLDVPDRATADAPLSTGTGFGPAPPNMRARTEPAAVNLAVLERLRELDESEGMGLAREVLGIFLHSAPQGMAQARTAVDRGDAPALERAAHALKSSAANVGADILSGRLRALEALARERRMDEAVASFEKVQHEFERVVSDAREILKENI